MVNKSIAEEDWCSGHALMATATPIDYVTEHGMEKMHPHKLPDLAKPDLAKMLNLCPALPVNDQELTPVMAWAFLLAHPRCPDLTQNDLEALKTELKPKVTCYG
jgi:hypothetical protein